jgi:hypothetical protein
VQIHWPTQGIEVGDLAGWVTALAAIVGLAFVSWQVWSARRTQREATANDTWMNYEQFGLKNPKYANPELSVLDYEKTTLDGDRQKFYEYEWFVSFMLLACDAVLILSSRAWEHVVKANLRYHLDYLNSEVFKEEGWDLQSTAIQGLINKLRREEARCVKAGGIWTGSKCKRG